MSDIFCECMKRSALPMKLLPLSLDGADSLASACIPDPKRIFDDVFPRDGRAHGQ